MNETFISHSEEIRAKRREEHFKMLCDNLDWFVENQPELVYLYEGKHLILRDKKVVGIFDDGCEARRWAASKFADGRYSHQHCLRGTQAYTINAIK